MATTLTLDQMIAYIQAGSLLVAAGAATVVEVKAMFQTQPAMTEDQLNAICDDIKADADRRADIARGDAGPN